MSALFFGFRISGGKNGIFVKVKTCFHLSPVFAYFFSILSQLPSSVNRFAEKNIENLFDFLLTSTFVRFIIILEQKF